MTRLRRVVVVGTGLIGTSIALALRRQDVAVSLVDRDAEAVRRAVHLGAGAPLSAQPDGGDGPADLAVLAVPPSATAPVLLAAQEADLARVYTDVASVKRPVVEQARRLGCDLTGFVPGHPLAGGHRSGPDAAHTDLFADQYWVPCSSRATPDTLRTVRQAVELTGARACMLDPAEHDRAVALSSHAPHVVSALLAAQFVDADEVALRLVGRGVLDTTRIAGGNPELWADILCHNADAVADVLDSIAYDLTAITQRLRAFAAYDGRDMSALRMLLEHGRDGRARLLADRDADE